MFYILLTMTNLTHTKIIERVGLRPFSEGAGINYGHAFQMKRNNSIPKEYWLAISKANLATLEELAQAVAKEPLS